MYQIIVSWVIFTASTDPIIFPPQDTVKNGTSSPTLHHKGVMTSIQGDRTLSEGVEQKSLASWVQSLLHTLTGEYFLLLLLLLCLLISLPSFLLMQILNAIGSYYQDYVYIFGSNSV